MPTGQSSRSERGGKSSGSPAHRSAAAAGSQQALRRWEKGVAIALFLLLALIAVQSGRLGASALYAQMAQMELDRWGSSRIPGAVSGLRRAEGHLSDSLRMVSGNPWALEKAGAAQLARMRTAIDPREALAAARNARSRYRDALLQRPASPFLWANLALTKLYLDQFDEEMFTALRHADELGPWEPAVQQTVLFVGLAAWDRLDPGLQQGLARTLERGALRNAPKMYEIVKSYRRYDLLCGIKKYNDMRELDCKRAGDPVPVR